MGQDSGVYSTIILALLSDTADDWSGVLSDSLRRSVRVSSSPDRVLEEISEAGAVACMVVVGTNEDSTLSFLETVRNRYPHLPLVLYPETGSEKLASRATEIGVTEYVHAGADTEHLATRIYQAIGASNPERRVQE